MPGAMPGPDVRCPGPRSQMSDARPGGVARNRCPDAVDDRACSLLRNGVGIEQRNSVENAVGYETLINLNAMAGNGLMYRGA